MNFAIVVMAIALWSNPAPVMKEKPVMLHAKGTFEVKVTPQKDDVDEKLSRYTLDKQFKGDLEGTSKGQMLAAGSAEGSGVYVAIERVTGTLQGRTGSFILHHRGVMTKGTPSLSVNVAPDSGTGELTGITGAMNIIITEGKHSYEFEYSLPQ